MTRLAAVMRDGSVVPVRVRLLRCSIVDFRPIRRGEDHVTRCAIDVNIVDAYRMALTDRASGQ